MEERIRSSVVKRKPRKATRKKRKRKEKRCTRKGDITKAVCGFVMTLMDEKGLALCRRCGATESWISETMISRSYKEGIPTHSPRYTYRPIGHFKELLNKVQAKSNTTIPKEVYTALKVEFDKIADPSICWTKATPPQIYLFLRRTGFSKYYDERYFITKRLNPNYHPLVMDDDHVSTLEKMFLQIFPHFHSVVKEIYALDPTTKQRFNFLYYPYVAYKLCQLQGYTNYLPFFSQLKDPAKLDYQDRVMARLFDREGWQFRPTSIWNIYRDAL